MQPQQRLTKEKRADVDLRCRRCRGQSNLLSFGRQFVARTGDGQSFLTGTDPKDLLQAWEAAAHPAWIQRIDKARHRLTEPSHFLREGEHRCLIFPRASATERYPDPTEQCAHQPSHAVQHQRSQNLRVTYLGHRQTPGCDALGIRQVRKKAYKSIEPITLRDHQLKRQLGPDLLSHFPQPALDLTGQRLDFMALPSLQLGRTDLDQHGLCLLYTSRCV